MARPLRIEIAGGLYHVTSRGNARNDIYLDDEDRADWLKLFNNVCLRFDWICHAYCLMDNHYHVIVETTQGDLSKGMRQLNGVYTQAFNRRHDRVGHVFQGRYKAIMVQKDSHLLELSRYVVLNPVRAQMVTDTIDWPWSSFQAMIGRGSSLTCLQLDWLLSQFASNRIAAIARYHDFVRAGIGLPSVWEKLKNQVFLGEDAFIAELQGLIRDKSGNLNEIPKAQRQSQEKELNYYVETFANAKDGMKKAYASGDFSLQQIADGFGVDYSTVSRAVKKG